MARLDGDTLTVEGGEEIRIIAKVQWGVTATHQEEVATLKINNEGELHVSRKKNRSNKEE